MGKNGLLSIKWHIAGYFSKGRGDEILQNIHPWGGGSLKYFMVNKYLSWTKRLYDISISLFILAAQVYILHSVPVFQPNPVFWRSTTNTYNICKSVKIFNYTCKIRSFLGENLSNQAKNISNYAKNRSKCIENMKKYQFSAQI